MFAYRNCGLCLQRWANAKSFHIDTFNRRSPTRRFSTIRTTAPTAVRSSNLSSSTSETTTTIHRHISYHCPNAQWSTQCQHHMPNEIGNSYSLTRLCHQFHHRIILIIMSIRPLLPVDIIVCISWCCCFHCIHRCRCQDKSPNYYQSFRNRQNICIVVPPSQTLELCFVEISSSGKFCGML